MGRGARAKERVTRPQCAESSESAGAVDGRRDEDWDALRHQRMGCDGVERLDHPVGCNGPGDRCRRGMKELLAAVQRGRRAVCSRGRDADRVLPSVEGRAGPPAGDRACLGRPPRVRARQPDGQPILGIVGLRDCRGTDGRGLVLFGWVAQDQSLGRAVSVSLYLVNTLLLIGAPSFAALAASVPDRVALRSGKRTLAGIGAGLEGVAVLAATGAVPALGGP